MKEYSFHTLSHPATTSPSQLSCSTPDIIYDLCFEFIFLSHCFVELKNNCQMSNCQITFWKVFLSISNKWAFIGSHLNAANFHGTKSFCYTIWRLKLDVPWGHMRQKKTLLPWYSKYFRGFLLIIASKTQK